MHPSEPGAQGSIVNLTIVLLIGGVRCLGTYTEEVADAEVLRHEGRLSSASPPS